MRTERTPKPQFYDINSGGLHSNTCIQNRDHDLDSIENWDILHWNASMISINRSLATSEKSSEKLKLNMQQRGVKERNSS